MKTLRLLIFAVALIAFAVVIVPAAGAVTIGSKCVSNSGAPYTLFTTATASGESYVVPFNGVVTEWGTDHTDASDPGVVAAVFGSPSGPNWKLSQVTPFQFVAPGAVVSYPVRAPVSAGQFLGSTTVNDTNPVMCQTGNGTDAGVYGSAYSVGDSFAPTSINQYKAAIWATVEPDVDGDGYGDIT